jgi:hypothetical protein
MLSRELNFCQGPRKVFSLCGNKFYQCLYSEWNDTHALLLLVCSMDIALNNQPFMSLITTTIQTRSVIQPTPFFLIGPKITTKTGTRKTSLTVPFLYYQTLFKEFVNRKKN